MDTPFERIVLMAPREFDLPELGTKTEVVRDWFSPRLPLALWEQAALPVRARAAAVLYCPSYIGPLVSSAPVVVANHGIYERIPDEFSKLQRLRSTTLHRLSARRAARVIANSKNTKGDVAEFFHVPPERIDVVYPAANEIFFQEHDDRAVANQVESVFGRRCRYLIFVGKLARRRHLPNLIQAFAELRRQGSSEHRLLLVGPNTIRLDVRAVAAAHGVADDVFYIPHLEQEPLALLYAGADAFVLPTTYEGISHTMLEAMASGAPVLTVEHPTLDEGGGDAVLRVSSPSVADLLGGLRTLLTEDQLRRQLSEQGRVRARRFSWAATAAATMAILAEVAEGNAG